jgi:hypothetical protein
MTDTSLANIGYVGLGRETTEGVQVPPTIFLPVSSFSIDSSVEPIIPEQLRGSRDKYVMMPSAYSVSGTMEMELPSAYIGPILVGAMAAAEAGGITTSAYAGGGYQHVIVPGSSAYTYTFETSAADILYMRYGGIRVNTLDINASFNEIVTASVGLEGTTRTKQGSGTSESYAAGNPFHFDGASAYINGSQVGNIKNFAFTMGNNIDRVGTLRKTTSWSRTTLGARDVGLTMTMDFQNTTDYDLFLAGTEFAVILHLEAGYITGSSGPRRTLVISIPRAIYSTINAPLTAGSMIEQSVTCTIVRPVNNDPIVTMTYIAPESTIIG